MSNQGVTFTLAATVPVTRGGAASSARVRAVAAMFGLGADADQSVAVLPPVTLTLAPGRLIFVTGPSGSGKSTLLRTLAAALPAAEVSLMGQPIWQKDDSAGALVDQVDAGRLPLDAALRVLSLAGLGDAFVLLRRPCELSDGQRHRYQLARHMAAVEIAALAEASSPSDSSTPPAASPPALKLLLLDEFGATLDRTTAAAVARNLRRWVAAASNVCVVVATTHDDLLEPLQPDVLVLQGHGEAITVLEQPSPLIPGAATDER